MKNICLYGWGDGERVLVGGNGDGEVVFNF